MNTKISKVLILTLILVFLGVFFFHSCAYLLINQLYSDLGNRNWKIDLLHGYTIQQINGSEVLLIKESPKSNTNIVIPTNISAYWHSNDYAGFSCENVQSATKTNDDTLCTCYYLLDMGEDLLLGPYSQEEFEAICLLRQIEGCNDWTPTSPRPDEAQYQ